MKKMKRIDGELARRANHAIAHGALTNSKRAQCFVKGVYPEHLSHGLGAYVFDTYKNRYVDFIAGLGSNLLGYGQEEIAGAIAKQARLGATLSLGSELEVRCAERVKEFVPFIQRLRFLKTGSDATTAALIVARSATGRTQVLSEGYHGWHPEFTSLTPPAHGCPIQTGIRKLTSLDLIDKTTAAVIVEPIITDDSKERIDWLFELRERCTLNGAVLIFDEVITGFRVPSHTVAVQHGLIPDLICLGKAMGGGMPLAVLGGSAEIMESDYFVSSTFAGETLSLAAAMKFLDLIQNKFKIDALWERGGVFLSRFNEIGSGLVKLEGYPTRSRLVTETPLQKALFLQECCKAAILMGPSLFFIFPHVELMDEVLSTIADIVSKIKTGAVELEGEMPQAPFAERVRQ